MGYEEHTARMGDNKVQALVGEAQGKRPLGKPRDMLENNIQIEFKEILWDCLDWSHIQGIHKRMVQFQKLTRNLFLTLHGHNVHRQQRQLSKFLMH
jgi:hypothetical protein